MASCDACGIQVGPTFLEKTLELRTVLVEQIENVNGKLVCGKSMTIDLMLCGDCVCRKANTGAAFHIPGPLALLALRRLDGPD